MTELMEGVGDVGLEEAEDEADNGRIYIKHIRVEKSDKPFQCDNCACTIKVLIRIAYLVRSKSSCLHNRTRRRLVIPAAVVGDTGGTGVLSRKSIVVDSLISGRYDITSRMALEGRSPGLMAAEGKTGSSGGSSVWQPRETFLGPTSGLEREPLLRDISSMSRRPCIGKEKSFVTCQLFEFFGFNSRGFHSMQTLVRSSQISLI